MYWGETMKHIWWIGLIVAAGVVIPLPGKAQDKKEPDLTAGFAASDPDFKIQGEYVGEVPGKGKYGVQVVALGGGKFDVYFLGGGLPGAGWDTKTRVKVSAATKDKKAVFVGSA